MTERKDAILKPCPFCGNSVKLSKWEHRGQQYYSVGCGCDVMMKSNPSCGQGWLRQEDAVKCWNTRDDKEITNLRETVNAIKKADREMSCYADFSKRITDIIMEVSHD